MRCKPWYSKWVFKFLFTAVIRNLLLAIHWYLLSEIPWFLSLGWCLKGAIGFIFLASCLVSFNRRETQTAQITILGIAYYEYAYIPLWTEEKFQVTITLEGGRGWKQTKKPQTPVEIMEAETFLLFLRRAAESKFCEKNKGGNVSPPHSLGCVPNL